MSHTTAAAAHHHSPEEIRREIRRYTLVGIALAVGTVVTVLASYINFGPDWINIAVALAIAIVKGSLVAGFFMHLVSERVLIYAVLIATVFLFAGLMYLTIWSMNPASLIHIK